MNEIAMNEPKFPTGNLDSIPALRPTGTFLTPTRADLSDLKPLMRGHPIGEQPGLLYYTEYDPALSAPIATMQAVDVVELIRVKQDEPIPIEARMQAYAYEMSGRVLILYKKKDPALVS